MYTRVIYEESVCHALEEDVTSMIREVNGCKVQWGWRRVVGDRNEDKEDISEFSVVLYKLNSIEMLMLGQFQKMLNG